jgi:dihydroxyacetone kinase-like predicted kinase
VVGDASTLKVHLHTDEPERATSLFAQVGEISRLDIADMRLQVAERDERMQAAVHSNGASSEGLLPEAAPSRARCGALAVVSGDGLARMFAELGVCTIDGGPTMNPSTYELLAAIHEVPAEEVLVLPSSPNVTMAAERAAELSDKQVLVAPAAGQQAGLVAAVALEADRGVQENARAFVQALEHVRTGAVAPAARDDAQGRFKRGEAVGFLGEDVIAWGDPAQTLAAVIASLAEEAELISCLAGADAPLAPAEIEVMVNGDTELELRDGGQHAYWWLLAAE